MKKFILFLVLVVMTLSISELLVYCLNLNSLLYNSLFEKMALDKVDKYFSTIRKWQMLGYILLPILIFLKTQIIAGILNIGAFFFNVKLPHVNFWIIVIKAEFVFLSVGLIKIVWFYFFQNNYTLDDVHYFYPLSMLQVIGHENLQSWFIYPLQAFNVFEVIYFIVLALLIDKELKISENRNTGIKIVISSYGPALFLWITSIMFFTLNIS